MKSTGVIRKIDELGRIVIPKEIRKNLRINDGENIEILIDNENVILKKFSMLSKTNEIAIKLSEIVYNVLKKPVIITDRDVVISATGPLKSEYTGKEISDWLTKKIENRDSELDQNINEIELLKNKKIKTNYFLYPVISESNVVGMVIMFGLDKNLADCDTKICQIISKFLSLTLEE